MKPSKILGRPTVLSISFILLLTIVATFVIAKQQSLASAVTANSPIPQMEGLNTPAPIPLPFSGSQTSSTNYPHSSTLSYYFISGITFTADLGTSFYARQVIG